MGDDARTAMPATKTRASRRAIGRGVLVAAVPAIALGCSPGGDASPPGRACTTIGCQDGLVVRVLPTEAWPPGEYRFDIEQDGARVTCTGTLPLPPCDRRGLACDAPAPMIVESGCALEPAAHAFGDVIFSTTPAEVSIVVTHQGQQVGAGRWRPVYQTSRPNGPGCEPVCTEASVDLVLSFVGAGGHSLGSSCERHGLRERSLWRVWAVSSDPRSMR
jgi:hypothetical protein